MLRIFALTLALVGSAPALAGPNATQPTPAVSGQVADSAPVVKEKKICRSEPSGTGSIMPTRTCQTQAERDAISQASQAQAEEMLRQQDATSH